MNTITLGIDIAKATFDVALWRDGKFKTKHFANTDKGHAALLAWLLEHDAPHVHACLEATGEYSTALATFLYDHGQPVSVVNPLRIKGFAQSLLTRNKTDAIDARVIARFCAAHEPPPWSPPPIQIRQLQALLRRRDALDDMRQQERNRWQTTTASLQADIAHHIDYLDTQIARITKQIDDHIDQNPQLRQQRALIETIPAIGPATSARVIAFLGPIRQFRRAKQASAFVGLSPRQHTSGSSVHKRARLSKCGDPQLRKALFFPALVAQRFNPVIRLFSQRLLRAGKPKMLVLGASMRKLVHLIYGVLKSGKPFDTSIATQMNC